LSRRNEPTAARVRPFNGADPPGKTFTRSDPAHKMRVVYESLLASSKNLRRRNYSFDLILRSAWVEHACMKRVANLPGVPAGCWTRCFTRRGINSDRAERYVDSRGGRAFHRRSDRQPGGGGRLRPFKRRTRRASATQSAGAPARSSVAPPFKWTKWIRISRRDRSAPRNSGRVRRRRGPSGRF
jgi:hypothetical protein